MEKPKDEYDALRMLVEILEQFDKGDRERLIRWTAERLSMSVPSLSVSSGSASRLTEAHGIGGSSVSRATMDLKSFVDAKDPKSEVQFAATIAYYYVYEATADDKKESINKTVLSEAANRIVKWKRGIKNPAQTLVNAYNAGVLDRTAERGEYKLNMVGENLVGVLLPGGGNALEAKRIPSSRKQNTASSKKRVKARVSKAKASRQAKSKK